MLSGKVIFSLVLGVQAGMSSTKVFIPTSAALDVAEKVAKGEGYSLVDRNKFFFDVMLDDENRPVFLGDVTVGFFWNGEIVSAIDS